MKEKKNPDRHEAAVVLAKQALLEVTNQESFIDSPVIVTGSEVLLVEYPSQLPGYPGWKWTLSLSNNPGLKSTVLEVSLLPGEDSLIAPEWVPWAARSGNSAQTENGAITAGPRVEEEEDSLELREGRGGLDIDELDTEHDGEPELK